MNNPKQLSIACAGFSSRLLLAAILASTSFVFLFAGFTMAQTKSGDSPLLPWIGVWNITDSGTATAAPTQKSTVEIRPTSDQKGLEISRHNPRQPDVSETLIPDGTRRPLVAQNCTGWQTARWIPEAGLILESSEMACKEMGSFATSTLKMILETDQMAEILLVKTAGQSHVAVRRLTFERDLTSASDLPPAWVATSARTAISAPWSLDTIIQLSKSIDTSLLEAAMIEKKVRTRLNAQSLRQMQAAKTPKEIIDLTVALAYPDQFHIEKNGQVVLRPWLTSSTSASASASYAPGFTTYYPGAFYNCYSPQGYFGYSGFDPLAFGSCWSYYSPFWWDYPIYIPAIVNNGGAGNGSGSSVPGGGGNGSGYGVPVVTPGGYARIQPINPPHARPRGGNGFPSAGNPGAGWQNQSGASGGSPSYSGGGGSVGTSAGGSSAPSASPGGYSSGGSGGGGQAVPK
jgi:hypothetical protein